MQQHRHYTQKGMKHECNIDGGDSVAVLCILMYTQSDSNSFSKPPRLLLCTALLTHSLTHKTQLRGLSRSADFSGGRQDGTRAQLSEVEVEGGTRHT